MKIVFVLFALIGMSSFARADEEMTFRLTAPLGNYVVRIGDLYVPMTEEENGDYSVKVNISSLITAYSYEKNYTCTYSNVNTYCNSVCTGDAVGDEVFITQYDDVPMNSFVVHTELLRTPNLLPLPCVSKAADTTYLNTHNLHGDMRKIIAGQTVYDDTWGQCDCNVGEIQYDTFVYSNDGGECKFIPVSDVVTLKEGLENSAAFNGNCAAV